MKLLSLLFNQVTYEGWHKMWESGHHGLPEADIRWLKEDAERGLFQQQMSFEDKHGTIKKRKVLKISWSGGGRRGARHRLFFSQPCVFLETSRCVGLQPSLSKVWVPSTCQGGHFSVPLWLLKDRQAYLPHVRLVLHADGGTGM